MPLTNRSDRYGWISVGFHWGVALVVFGLFGVGLYMVGLGYYDPLYNRLPHWHRSVGILLAIVVVLRLIWRWLSPPPPPLPTHTRWEQRLAKMAHGLLYVLLFALIVSGYLMSTADGRGFSVFGWFEMPALVGRRPGLEDTAGDAHEWIAWSLMALVALHVAGALKHHFIDRDATLRRMFGMRAR